MYGSTRCYSKEEAKPIINAPWGYSNNNANQTEVTVCAKTQTQLNSEAHKLSQNCKEL